MLRPVEIESEMGEGEARFIASGFAPHYTARFYTRKKDGRRVMEARLKNPLGWVLFKLGFVGASFLLRH